MRLEPLPNHCHRNNRSVGSRCQSWAFDLQIALADRKVLGHGDFGAASRRAQIDLIS
jgi:hypothetical protein